MNTKKSLEDCIKVSIQIRKIKADDVNDIIRIYSTIVRCDISSDFKESIERQINVANNQITTCYVADDSGSVVGFMIGYILAPGFGIEKSAWIAALGVDPHYMGRDIGKLMANKLFKFYKTKGINIVHTSVLWDSTDVLSFFKAIGFDKSRFIELEKKLD